VWIALPTIEQLGATKDRHHTKLVVGVLYRNVVLLQLQKIAEINLLLALFFLITR